MEKVWIEVEDSLEESNNASHPKRMISVNQSLYEVHVEFWQYIHKRVIYATIQASYND